MKHIAIYFMGRLLTGSIGLVSIYILTRILSPEEYGNFALLIAIVTFISGVSYQWLVISTSRLINEYKTKLPTFLRAVIILFVFSTVIVSILMVMANYIYPKITENLYWILVVITISLGGYNLLSHLANIAQKPFIYSALAFIRAISSLFVSIAFIRYLDLSAEGAVLGFGIGFILAILVFFAYFNTYISSINLNLYSKSLFIDTKLIITLYRYGIPLSLTYLSIMIINLSDRLMLGKMSNMVEVASYSAAYDLSQQTVGVIMNIFFLAYFPKILNAYSNKKNDEVFNKMRQLSTILLGMGTLVSILFFITSSGIATIMFGSGLAHDTIEIMPLIVLGVVVGSYKGFYIDIVFQLTKRTDIQLKITLLMAFSNILLNIFLIPSFGSKGAAISTLISFLLGSMVSWIYAKRELYVSLPIDDIIKIIISGLVVLIISTLIGFNLTTVFQTLMVLVILSFSYIIFIFTLNVMDVQTLLLSYYKKQANDL